MPPEKFRCESASANMSFYGSAKRLRYELDATRQRVQVCIAINLLLFGFNLSRHARTNGQMNVHWPICELNVVLNSMVPLLFGWLPSPIAGRWYGFLFHFPNECWMPMQSANDYNFAFIYSAIQKKVIIISFLFSFDRATQLNSTWFFARSESLLQTQWMWWTAVTFEAPEQFDADDSQLSAERIS